MDDIRPPRSPQKPVVLPKPQSEPVTKQLQQEPQIASRSVGKPKEKVQSPLSLSAQNPFFKRKKIKWIIAIIIVILVVMGTIAAGIWWYNDALQPKSAQGERSRIAVDTGATLEHVANELEQKGVIKNAFIFQIFARQQGKTQVRAGVYYFSPVQAPSQILQWLVDGKTDNFNVTILPGNTLVGIKQGLQKDGFEASAIDTAFAKQYNHPLLKSKPETANLEGYIFPETYEITSETTVEQVLVKTFDELYKRIQNEELETKLASRGFTLHEGIVLASIVQKEVSNPTDQRQVAQVFEKRLQIDMPLGSDVTFIYAAGLLGVEATPALDSPYNTRKYKGLPPGAISNFNLPALRAVADPAPGDFLFFVAGDDGTTHFARSLEEHNRNIEQYCTTLCSSN